MALECTLIYLGYKQLEWSVAQKALADMKFLDRLKNYDKDAVSDNILQKVKTLTKKQDFNIERMTKASKAAGGLARWCKAIRDYAESLKVVRPLQAKQTQMTERLMIAQQAVKVKEAEVQQIKQKL